VPDSYGKRQRDAVKARKAAAREERRIARRERRSGGPISSEGDFTEGASAEDAVEEPAPTDPSESEEVVDLEDRATTT
jgi:hypothetical protein